MNPAIRASLPRSKARHAFLVALAADLRAVGWRSEVALSRTRVRFLADYPPDPKQVAVDTAAVIAWRCAARSALLDRAARMGLPDKFHPDPNLAPDRIDPRIVLCRSRKQHDVFSFAQLQQSVASAPRPGRRIRLLVIDQGQPREALIGVMELASPIFTLACRDKALGWSGAPSNVRIEGLRRTMDLSTCLAMPPYAELRAGKLLALLAASDVVGELFLERYGEPLGAIFATCATGLHYPQLNRLNVRPGGLYRRIGATAGYSTAAFSSNTFAAARALQRHGPAAAFGPQHQKGLRLLRSAMRKAGLDPEPFLRSGLPKGVYVCDVPGDGIAAMRQGCDPQLRPLPAAECSQWWRQRVLSPLLLKHAKQGLAIATPAAIR